MKCYLSAIPIPKTPNETYKIAEVMAEKESIHIEKNKEQPHSLDFKSLRQHGIELVQQLSGHTWTDYNLHDPGVTILEILCVAITDLAYRTDFPIQDLLVNEHGYIQSKENSFFPKEEIFTTNPVTINDIRKAIQDEIEDVYNVWLEPVLSSHSPDCAKGLYKIYVQMTKEAAARLDNEKGVEEQIKGQVRKSFVSKRNLCEDWVRDIVILNPVKITISADVRITEKKIPEDILAIIYNELENYLNPPIKYYSENELLSAGFKIEDIYAGPLLEKGIIPDAEMGARRRKIDPDGLIRKIMEIEGVINVKNLTIHTPEGSTGNKPYKLDEFHFPYLKVNRTETSIRIFKGENEATIEMDTFNDLFMRKLEVSKRNFLSSFHQSTNKHLKGINKDIEQYYSIQNHFPMIYGMGKEGLSKGETDSRKAQAKQLKAYLMLFEQLLANYLSQLANGKNLFSTDLTSREALTYYYQPLYNIPGVKELLKAFTSTIKNNRDTEWEAFKSDKNNEYINSIKKALETDNIYRERKNKIFDHLLARFNIELATYPVTLFNLLYGNPTVDQRVDEVLKWKSDMIGNRVELSRDRIKAFDYLAEPGKVQDFTGFQKKLAKLLYIQNQRRRPLSWVFNLRKTTSGETENIHSLAWHGNHYRNSTPKQDNNENHPIDSYDFGNQTIAVFKYGIDINNYKIIQDTGKDSDYLIMFKAPQEKKWIVISRKYVDKSSAIVALKELINYLKQISIESEGFHIIEYILLRPPLKSQSFGFGFYENENTLLFQHNHWTDFDEREKLISEILEMGTNTEDTSQLYRKVQFPEDKESTSSDNLSIEDEKKSENVQMNIRLKKEQKTLFFPRFELWVKRSNGIVIKEDYFNFRMAVVLPAWPARFQDKNFREFTENLFRLNAPAHIRIDFYWLNISDMKKFEKLYFEWLNFLTKQEINLRNSILSEKLITFLNGDNYRAANF